MTNRTFSTFYLCDDDIVFLCENYSSSSFDRIINMPGNDLYNIVIQACKYLCSISYGGSGGGDSGGSSGGGDSGEVVPPELPKIDRSPKELANAKDKFVAFSVTRDCMATCKLVMDKFRQIGRYGDSGHVFQLMINDTENKISYYPRDATTLNNAMDCIDTHLNNNRAIIVGVNILDHIDVGNIDGTDHFVVIIGRGSDEQGRYYIYMETGTSFPEQGYNPSENRLYVNSETNGLTDLSNFQDERYDVTNVRPNDGNSYDTTAVKSTF